MARCFNASGNNGDADLYAKISSKPTTSSYGCQSDGSTSAETRTINALTAGRYYIGVYAWSAFSGLTVTVTAN